MQTAFPVVPVVRMLPDPRLPDQSFVLPGRTVQVITDRTARGDFFVGDHSAGDKSVAKKHSSAWLQDAKHLAQHVEPSWNVTQNIICEHRVKGSIPERQRLRGVAMLEVCQSGDTVCGAS